METFPRKTSPWHVGIILLGVLVLACIAIVTLQQRTLPSNTRPTNTVPPVTTTTQPTVNANVPEKPAPTPENIVKATASTTLLASDFFLRTAFEEPGRFPFQDLKYDADIPAGRTPVAPPEIAGDYQLILAIPSHTSNAIVRVFLRNTGNLAIYWYDPISKTYVFLGDATNVSCTGNSGALYVPVALTSDDKNLIMSAVMGDAGAGGGATDYGYSLVPLYQQNSPQNSLLRNFSTCKMSFIANRPASFYDDYSKVLYTTSSNLTPEYSQPGPYNTGTLMYRDLLTKTARILLQERDTEYAVDSLDAIKKTATLHVTKYTFSRACPREENALLCAEKTTTTRTISIP